MEPRRFRCFKTHRRQFTCSFTFFNLTNPAEVLNGDKPFVLQVGPYTYREYRPKEEVKFLDNGTRVQAVNPKTYVFEPNMSRGSEDDIIRTVNIPAVTVMEKTKDQWFEGLVSALMKSIGVGVFGTFRVGDLLWGYEDPLLKLIQKFITMDDHFGLFYNVSGRGVCCQSSPELVQVSYH
ncbi:lysosome membrane protein 2-like [Carassius auratus]|uniref:Lysosome membrane protein 2-like n=1 Tax=Carassius auratus TaxID=7957 RepID=A0A6P6NPC4_CARAU|nr:lysosome membrane protein 2-like [Carassius auratus]